MRRLQRLAEFAARTPVLVATSGVAMALLVFVFPALPVGGELLDARFGYSHADANAAMSAYGEQGRRVYVWASLTMDTLLPIAYAGFLAGMLYRLRPREGLRTLALLPVAAGLLDYSENAQIVAMLIGYPDVSPGQVALASATTQAKTCALLVALALVAVFVVLALGRRWTGERPLG